MPGKRSYFNAMAKCEALTVKQAGRFRDDEARGRNPRKHIKGFQKYLRTIVSYVLRVIVRACEREEIPPPLNGSDWLAQGMRDLVYRIPPPLNGRDWLARGGLRLVPPPVNMVACVRSAH